MMAFKIRFAVIATCFLVGCSQETARATNDILVQNCIATAISEAVCTCSAGALRQTVDDETLTRYLELLRNESEIVSSEYLTEFFLTHPDQMTAFAQASALCFAE